MDPLNTTDPSLIWPTDPSFRDFPKRLPEDCVEYTIHVLESGLHNAALRSRLLEIQRAAAKLKKEFCRGYIWQREGFELSLDGGYGGREDDDGQRVGANEEEGAGFCGGESTLEAGEADTCPATQPSAEGPYKLPPRTAPLHLHGRTHHGDSIADEWLVVYLLRQLSLQHPQAWIRVWDADGDFLLIEAANELPEWLEPDCSGNRVWTNDGRVVVIPAEIGRSNKNRLRSLNLDEALDCLRQHQANPKAHSLLDNPTLTAAAFMRCLSSPERIRQNLHTSTLRLPRKLAYLLHRKPQWVSPAVEAFYLRDPVAMRTLRGEARSDAEGYESGLIFPPTDLVDIPVKMQRVGFAQLRGQQFATPEAWTHRKRSPSERLRTRMRNKDLDALTTQKRTETGMKLTCGFEMLLSDPQQKQKREVREMQMLLEDLEEGEEVLPDDSEVQAWCQSEDGQEDSESWLDIDFEAFERELKGKSAGGEGAAASDTDDAPTRTGDTTGKDADALTKASADHGNERAAIDVDPGFGDKATQDNLRRMVARFEDYLKTEEEGDDAEPTTKHTANVNAADDADDYEGEDSDASYHPDSDSEDDDSDEPGSSEEEGWGEEAEDDEVSGNVDEADEEVSEDELKEMIKEMQEMGIKTPPAPGTNSEKENKELREALMTLSETKPIVEHLFLDRGDAPQSTPAAMEQKGKGKGRMPQKAQRMANGRVDSEDEEIEEVTRDMEEGEGVELSSDDEDVDPFDPKEAKSFEELFGRELKEAGVLK